MIKIIKSIFFAAALSIVSGYSIADVSVDCAQEVYTDNSGQSTTATAVTGEACKQDIGKGVVNQIIGEEEGIFYQLISFLYPLFIIIALVFLYPIIKGIVKLANYNHESEDLSEAEYREKYFKSIRNSAFYMLVALVVVNPIVWFKKVKFETDIGIYAFNYMSRVQIAKSERALLDANEPKTDDLISSVFTGVAYLSSAVSEEMTRRYTNRNAYIKLGSDTTDDCFVFCKTIDLSLDDFLQRINSCDTVSPDYNLVSNWNRELSLLNVVWTKQNDSILIKHTDTCSEDFAYKNENYGYSKSTLRINFEILKPYNKSYLNKDYKENIFTVKLLQDEATKQEAGFVKSKYEKYANATAAQRLQQVNSGKSPNYFAVVDQGFIDSEASESYEWALKILNSKSDFFKGKPEAALISFIEILNERNGGYDGKNREGRNELEAFRKDAAIAANELIKLECAMPGEAIQRVVNAVNSNGMVPYNDSTVKQITDSLLSSPLKCSKFTSTGLETTTSYTEQEKDRSMKIIQDFLLKRIGYDISKKIAIKKAKGLFFKDYKNGFKASIFAQVGGFGQIPQIFGGMDNSKVASLLADSDTVDTRYSIKIDPSKKSDYIDYEIATGQKKNDNNQELNSNDYIRLFDYVDNGIGTYTNNPSRIVGNKISDDNGLAIEQFFKYLREQIRFCTPNINLAFGLEGGCNIYEFAEKCAMSVQICWPKQETLAFIFTGSLETTITLVETAVVLKVISSAGSLLESGGDIIGSISGSEKAGKFAKTIGFLFTNLIQIISNILSQIAELFTFTALCYFLTFCMCFYMIYYLARKFLILVIDIFINPLVLFIQAVNSGLKGDKKAWESAALHLVNIITQFALLGSYTAIVSKLVMILSAIMLSGFFEVLLTVRARFYEISQIAFEVVGYCAISFILIISIATAAYLFERMSLSLQSIFKQETYEKDGNFLAVTAMVATGTATAAQLGQLTNAVVKGTAIQSKRLAAKKKR